MPSFFAIRPITTSRFVVLKMIAAGIGALVSWGLVIALFCIWAIVEASPLNPRESLVRAAFADASLREVLLVSAALFGLLAMSWRELVTGMWLTLTGSKWLAIIFGAFTIVIISLAAIAGQWIYKHPDVQPRLMACIPWLVAVMVVLKFGAVAWICIALRKHGLVTARAMKPWFGAWIVACIGLFSLLWLLTTPTLTMAGAVFLMLPLTRVAIAPLALHWNRHQ